MSRRSCSDRPVAYTFAPALASSRAMPRPTPLLAPVTMATLPCSVCIMRLYDAGSGRVLEKWNSRTHLRTDAGDHRLHPNEFATFSVSDRRSGEQVEHLRRGRRLQDVTGREVFWPLNGRAILFRHTRWRSARQVLEHGDLAVPVDEVHGKRQIQQALHRLACHWTWQHVAANHDVIDGRFAHLFENGFKCRQVAVNVVEGGHASDRRVHVR